MSWFLNNMSVTSGAQPITTFHILAMSPHWPGRGAAPGGPWSLMHDGGTCIWDAPERPPSSCPYLRAAWLGSPSSPALPLTCAFEGRCGCFWHLLLKGLSRLGRSACDSRALCPPGRLPSGCFWFALVDTEKEEQEVRTHVLCCCLDATSDACIHVVI